MRIGLEIRFAPIFLSILGLLIAVLPHALLPLREIVTVTGAAMRPICSLRYHPEFYLGLGVVVTAVVQGRFPSRFLWILILLEGALLIYQGANPRPVSYYDGTQEWMVILANRRSITSHAAYREANVLAGLALACFAFFMRSAPKSPSASMSFFALALRNLRRKAFRNLALVAMWATATLCLFLAVFLYSSASKGLRKLASFWDTDLIVYPAQAEKPFGNFGGPYVPGEWVARLSSMRQVSRASAQVDVVVATYPYVDYTEIAHVIAFDPVSDFVVRPQLSLALPAKEGRINAFVGRLVKFHPGQGMQVLGQDIYVDGTLARSGIEGIDRGVFVPLKALHLLDPTVDKGAASRIFLDLKEGVEAEAFAGIVRDLSPELTTVMPATLKTKAAKQILRPLGWFVILAVVVCLTVTFIGLNVLLMMVRERRRDISVLRVLGARLGDTALIFGWESGLVIGTGFLVGLGAAVFLLGYANEALVGRQLGAVPVAVSGAQLSLSAIVSVVLVALAGGLNLYLLKRYISRLAILEGMRTD